MEPVEEQAIVTLLIVPIVLLLITAIHIIVTIVPIPAAVRIRTARIARVGLHIVPEVTVQAVQAVVRAVPVEVAEVAPADVIDNHKRAHFLMGSTQLI